MKKIIYLAVFAIFVLLIFLVSVNTSLAATQLKTVEYFINSTTDLAGGKFWNSTFYVYIPETSVSVKSAYIQVYGHADTVAATEEIMLNGTLLGAVTIPLNTEWFGYSFLVNGTNTTTKPAGELYGLSSGTTAFNFAVRCTNVCNSTSAKAVITYSYDDASTTQLKTQQIFLNVSDKEAATNVMMNLTNDYPVQILDTSPTVYSAWFEVGGLSDSSATSQFVEVRANQKNLTKTGFAIFRMAAAGAEAESFRILVNASSPPNVENQPIIYSIANNNVFPLDLSVRCVGDDCTSVWAKLYITYSHTANKQDTKEFFVNSTSKVLAAATLANKSFNILIPETGITINNAFFEITGHSATTNGLLSVFLNGTHLETFDIAAGAAAAESFSFRILTNGTNSTNPSGLLYGIQGNTLTNFNFAVRPSAAINTFAAKAVITYSYTTRANENIATFFVNGSTATHASNGYFTTQFPVQLPEGSPVVNDAWFEILGTNGAGTADWTLNVWLNQSAIQGTGSGILYDSVLGGTPGFGIIPYFNATSAGASVYSINNGNVYVFNLSMQCAGNPCSGMSAILKIKYSFTPTEADTDPPQFNTNGTSVSNGTQYVQARNYGFHINWTDATAVDKVVFETNMSNTSTYTVANFSSPCLGQTTKRLCAMNFTDLAANTYYYRWYANDTGGYANTTNQYTWYTVIRNISTSYVHLAINGSEVATQTKQYPEATNATGWNRTTDKGVTFTLYRNTTTSWTGSPVSENIRLGVENYNYTYVYPGSQNYTATSKEITLTITKSDLNLTLYINKTAANYDNFPWGGDANFTIVTNSTGPKLYVELWTNFSNNVWKNWTAGIEPFINYTQNLNQGGNWSWFGNFSGNQNYTLGNQTWYMKISEKYVRGIDQIFSTTGLISRIQAFPRTTSNIFTTSAITDRLQGIFRIFTIQLNIDALTSKSQLLMKTITQQFSTSLDTSTTLARVRLVSITASFTESMQRILGIVRTSLNTFVITDFAQRVLTIPRLLTQGITTTALSDRLQDLSRLLSQTLSTTADSIRVRLFPRLLTQSISTTVLSDRLLDLTRVLTQILDITDISDRLRILPARIVSQTFTVSDSAIGKLVSQIFKKAVDLSVSFLDATQRIRLFPRLNALAISVTESTSRILYIFRALSQSLSTTAESIRVRLFPRLTTESLSVLISSDRILDITRILTNTISSTIDSIRIPVFPRLTALSVTVSDSATRLLNILRIATQSLDISDFTGRIRAFPRLTTLTVVVSESSARLLDILRTLSQPIALTDISARIPRIPRIITDSFTTSAITGRFAMLSRIVTELPTLNLISERIGLLSRVMSQSFTLTDTVGRIRAFPRLLTQTITTSAITDRLLGLTRTFSQLVNIGNFADRLRVFPGRIITQTFTMTDYVSTRRTLIISKLIDLLLSISDSANKIPTYVRQLSQGLSTTAITERLLDLNRLFTQSLSTTADAVRIRLFPRILTERITTLAISDRFLDLTRILSQSVSTTIDAIRTRLFPRTMLATLTITDSVGRLQDLVRTIAQSISLTDVGERIRILPRLLSERITTSAFTDRLLGLGRVLTDSISTTIDSIRIKLLPRLLTQTITTSALTDRLLGLTKIISDRVSATIDSIRIPTFPRILTDRITTAAVSDRVLSLIRVFSQTFSLDGFITRISTFSRVTTQQITTSAITDRILNLSRIFGETLTTAADTIRLRLFARTTLATITTTDSANRLLDLVRVLSNTISTTTDTIRQLAFSRVFALSVTTSETSSRVFSAFRTITQLFTLSDMTARIAGFSRITDVSINIQAPAGRLLDISRVFTQSLSLTDISTRILNLPRTVTQTFSLTQLTSKMTLFGRSVSLQFIINALFGYIIKAVSITFTIPDTTVSRGQFAEFDVNIENTGTTSLTVSSGIGVYNSTNNLIAIVNSSNVALPVGSSNTIVTFLSTLNLSTGSYKADAIVFFDGASTNNITKFFNVTTTVALPIGNYTNTSINITPNTTVEIVMNLSTTTIVNLSIVTDTNKTGAVAVVEYTSVENQTISGKAKLSKFIEITVNNETKNKLQWSWLNISYTDAEVTAANLEESSLRIWFYNSTTSSWQQESNSGVDTTRNYAWVNVTHLSLFGIYGTEIAAPTPTPAPTPSAGGGGIGRITPPVVPIPTVAVEFVKWPVLREVVAGQTIVEGIKIKNKNTDTVSNLRVEVSGIPTSWITVTPKSLDLSSKETKGFTLAMSVPSDATAGDYKVLVTLKNSGVEDTNFLILRVKSYAPTYDKPIITRVSEIDKEAEKTRVKLYVSNPVRDYDKVEIDEDVPKDLAQTSDEIQFITIPTEIKRKDPLISWSFLNFLANTEKNIEYILPRIPEEFTSLIYFPIKQMSLTTQKVPAGLRIVEFNIPSVNPGTTTNLKLVIENTNNFTKEFGFAMEVPAGWSITPNTISEFIKGNEMKEFELKLTVPKEIQPGIYIARAVFTFDGDTVIREYRLEILEMFYGLFLFGAVGIATAVVVFYLIRGGIRLGRPRAEYYLSTSGKLMKIKEAIVKKEQAVVREEVKDVQKLREELTRDVDKLRREIIEKVRRRLEERIKE